MPESSHFDVDAETEFAADMCIGNLAEDFRLCGKGDSLLDQRIAFVTPENVEQALAFVQKHPHLVGTFIGGWLHEATAAAKDPEKLRALRVNFIRKHPPVSFSPEAVGAILGAIAWIQDGIRQGIVNVTHSIDTTSENALVLHETAAIC